MTLTTPEPPCSPQSSQAPPDTGTREPLQWVSLPGQEQQLRYGEGENICSCLSPGLAPSQQRWGWWLLRKAALSTPAVLGSLGPALPAPLSPANLPPKGSSGRADP